MTEMLQSCTAAASVPRHMILQEAIAECVSDDAGEQAAAPPSSGALGHVAPMSDGTPSICWTPPPLKVTQETPRTLTARFGMIRKGKTTNVKLNIRS